MDEKEHWRLRLIELREAIGCTQAAMAADIDVDPTYFSRLLYPLGKKGRENLSLEKIRSLTKAYKLRYDWFDLPLGSQLPGAPKPEVDSAAIRFGTVASEPAGRRASSDLKWPFKETSYKRLQALVDSLGPKLGAEALRDLDSLLDVAVARWEQRAGNLGKRAS